MDLSEVISEIFFLLMKLVVYAGIGVGEILFVLLLPVLGPLALLGWFGCWVFDNWSEL